MPYVPLDRSILTSTLLKNGPEVVACWLLLLADCDRLGESGMTPAAAASLLRMSDEAAIKAFEVLQAPDPRSRSRILDGRRIVLRDNGRYLVVNAGKYQWLASKAAASKRQQEYLKRKAASSRAGHADAVVDVACDAPGCGGAAECAVAGARLCSRHAFDVGPPDDGGD